MINHNWPIKTMVCDRRGATARSSVLSLSVQADGPFLWALALVSFSITGGPQSPKDLKKCSFLGTIMFGDVRYLWEILGMQTLLVTLWGLAHFYLIDPYCGSSSAWEALWTNVFCCHSSNGSFGMWYVSRAPETSDEVPWVIQRTMVREYITKNVLFNIITTNDIN